MLANLRGDLEIGNELNQVVDGIDRGMNGFEALHGKEFRQYKNYASCAIHLGTPVNKLHTNVYRENGMGREK